MRFSLWTVLASVSLALIVVASGCGQPPTRSNVVSALTTSPRETTLKFAVPKNGRARPLVVVLADNDGTETTDFVIPYGVLKGSGAADVMTVSTGPGTVTLIPALRIRADMTLAQFDAATPGGADIVIASAGISAGTLTEHREDFAVFEQIVATNLTATVATFAPFIAVMKSSAASPAQRQQQRPLRLVGLASVAGIRGLPGAGAYSASKAAVISYCESLRVELRSFGIRVVTIAPGYIDTPMTQHNAYRMPFLMSAEAFARRAVKAIDAGDSFRVIPWQMGWVVRLLRWMPNALYDRVFDKMPRKARTTPDQ